MFGIDSSEFLLVALVALVVIGPKDLPKAMRVVGYWVGKARGVARQFRQGFDTMVREAELEEMEKKWAAENARILAEHPATPENGADPHAGAPTGSHGDDDQPAPVMTERPLLADGPAPLPPIHVEAPLVEPAPEGTPHRRDDGVTS